MTKNKPEGPDALSHLVTEWREQARCFEGVNPSAIQATFAYCADRLVSALLAQRGERQGDPLVLDMLRDLQRRMFKSGGTRVIRPDLQGVYQTVFTRDDVKAAILKLEAPVDTAPGEMPCTCAQESAPAFCRRHGEPLYRDPPLAPAGAETPQSDGDLLAEVGIDGAKWAAAFMRQHGGKVLSRTVASTPKNRLVDESDMLAWFCNAIMAGFDEANRRHRAGAETSTADLKARAMALVDRWNDPEFWKEEGNRMDSMDCAGELLVLLLSPTPPQEPTS